MNQNSSPGPLKIPSPIFQTPEEKYPRSIYTIEQQTAQKKQSVPKIPEPTLPIPSNLSRVLLQKKQERPAAARPSTSRQTNIQQPSKINIPKSINQNMTRTQDQNTTSRYGRQRKQTQFFTSGT